MRVAAGIPIAMANKARTAQAHGCHIGEIPRVSNHNSNTVAAEPAVPGAIGARPLPKNVPTTHAQAPAGALRSIEIEPTPGLAFFMIVTRVNFTVAGIADRRGNYVLAAGPFSQVDQPTSRAAERKFGVSILDRLFAGGA